MILHANESALSGGTAQGVEKAGLEGLPRDATTRRLVPKPGSIRAQVLEELRAGRSLTAMQAWRRLGAARLASDVHVLRRMGWPIVGAETLVACRSGRPSRVTTYRMDDRDRSADSQTPPVARHEG